jgi:hypothetical protein
MVVIVDSPVIDGLGKTTAYQQGLCHSGKSAAIAIFSRGKALRSVP